MAGEKVRNQLDIIEVARAVNRGRLSSGALQLIEQKALAGTKAVLLGEPDGIPYDLGNYYNTVWRGTCPDPKLQQEMVAKFGLCGTCKSIVFWPYIGVSGTQYCSDGCAWEAVDKGYGDDDEAEVDCAHCQNWATNLHYLYSTGEVFCSNVCAWAEIIADPEGQRYLSENGLDDMVVRTRMAGVVPEWDEPFESLLDQIANEFDLPPVSQEPGATEVG